MAQLPPKIPNMTQNWPEQKLGSMAATNSQNLSWVDEFLDFSAARRGTHRRSISDSIAFLELDQCPSSQNHNHNPDQSNGGFDDEHFMSMFSDDRLPNAVAPILSSSNPSTPSDHNSINDDKDAPSSDHPPKHHNQFKNEAEEVQSQCTTATDPNPSINAPANVSSDRIVDPKRVKR